MASSDKKKNHIQSVEQAFPYDVLYKSILCRNRIFLFFRIFATCPVPEAGAELRDS